MWRLAILALPWQARWFAEASLAGWPWEQGRWSFYASWILIAAAIVVGHLSRRRERSGNPRPMESCRPATFRGFWIFVLLPVLATAVACGLDRIAWTAALQWWLQVSVLALFAWTLVRSGIPRRTLAAWFVLSLIPHVALGYWQYAIQKVIGSPWLGIATQLPENPGVSVIEHGLYRVLRMYGGFPHPNVFAGWMTVGLVLALWLAATSKTKWRAMLWSVGSASLSIAVLLSYARSAWIAAAVGVVVLIIGTVGAGLKPAPTTDTTDRVPAPYVQYLIVALASAVLATFIVAIPEYDHLATRFDSSARLEAKSIETRVSGIWVGWDVFRRHPLVGAGPNAELLDVARGLSEGRSTAPLEPPHDAYLLALADVGIAGFLALAYLVLLLVRAAIRSPDRAAPLAILTVLATLSLFDHYPWSLWAGQSLVAMTLAISISQTQAKNAGISARTEGS